MIYISLVYPLNISFGLINCIHYSALHAAARNGHGGSVEILLKHGARPEIANTDRHHTAIFGACEKVCMVCSCLVCYL